MPKVMKACGHRGPCHHDPAWEFRREPDSLEYDVVEFMQRQRSRPLPHEEGDEE